MRKILILSNDSTYVYNLRLEVLQAMLVQKWEVHIACEMLDHVDELKDIGCELIPVTIERHGKNPFKDISLLYTYKRIIKKENPDVVLTYNIKSNVYGGMACASLNVPYLVNVCGLGKPVENPGLMQKLTVFLYRLGVRKSNCVFFQNTENEEFFNKRNMAPGHHHLLPGSGVNINKFDVLEYPNDNTVEFLYISRILKEKGIDQYLDAAKYITKKYPNTVFHILGGCDDDKYLSLLKDLDRQGIVKYHGQQNSVLPFQKISSCTILPTYYPEGMNNVLLESAACGRPIITTNRSGCREIIDDEVNGYICNQKDSEDLIRQIEKFLNLSWEQRRDMGFAGRKKMEEEFNRDIVVKAYLDEIVSCF